MTFDEAILASNASEIGPFFQPTPLDHFSVNPIIRIPFYDIRIPLKLWWDISGAGAVGSVGWPAQPWFALITARPPPYRPLIGRRHGPPTSHRPGRRHGGGADRRPVLAPPSCCDSVLSGWEQYSVNTVLDGFRRFYQRSNRLSCSSSLDVHSAKLR